MTDLTTPQGGHADATSARAAGSGIGGAAMVAAACGARPPRTASSGTTEEVPAKTQLDQSATDAKLNWSKWLVYMDVDEEDGTRPTLDRFMEKTGIDVDYTEDVNDNDEFYAKVRPQLEAGPGHRA